MNPDCERWAELSDRDAEGQPLAVQERDFLRDHEQKCEFCAHELAAFRGLLIPPNTEAEPSERELDQVLGRVAETAARERRTRQRWAAGASALALAAGVALWFGRGAETVVDASAPAVAQRTAEPDAAPTATPAAPTRPEPSAESGCSQPVAGVVACTTASTLITDRDLDSKERFLELGRGHIVVSLAPQPTGTSFSIVTAAGRVTAVGTVFSVESKEDGTAVARVVEGKVAVRGKDGKSRLLRAGESLRLGDSKPAALTAAERERDISLLPADVRALLSQAPNSSAAAGEPAPAATPEALLEQALRFRARGQFRRAADVYRKIHEANPGSAIGGTALVSLGELSLSSLNDARGALTAFNTYLARGGALSQEAAFGKIRALRALGRTAEERSAIEQFLSQYPSAAQSRILRERLAALGQ